MFVKKNINKILLLNDHAFLLKICMLISKLSMQNHVKFFTKPSKFTKLNICKMLETHVNHGFRHVG